jgi:phenylacetate-CoA ligase
MPALGEVEGFTMDSAPRTRTARPTEFFNPAYETMEKGELVELSFQLFRREIESAYQNNSFYRRKFQRAGIKPSDIKTAKDVWKVPVSTKEEFLEDAVDYPPFGSRFQADPNQVSFIIETGGTTGRGQEVHPLSLADADKVYEAEAYHLFWTGARRGTVVMQTIPVTTGGAGIFWHGALHLKTKSCVVHIGNYPAESKLQLMRRYKAEILIATASYLQRLEYVADQLGMNLEAELRLKSILVLGGGIPIEWVLKREGIWGAKLYEHYGCTQRAFMGTCEYGMVRDGERGILHMLPHLCFVEVVDPGTGKHVEPGEEGELIITPLGSEASPIIRFASRDRARYLEASSCPCGRPLDGLESGSIGRADDMIKVKGVNVWQNAVDEVVFTHDAVVEYKGEVNVGEVGKEIASVLLEFHPTTEGEIRRQVMARILRDLRHSTGLTFVVDEWSGPSLIEEYGQDSGRKVRRWTDRRWKD